MTAYLMLNLVNGDTLDFSVVNSDNYDCIRTFGITVDLGDSTILFRESKINQSDIEQYVDNAINDVKTDVLPDYAKKTDVSNAIDNYHSQAVDMFAFNEDIPTVPKYYMHTLTITAVSSGTACCVTFMVMSKSSATFTVSSLYGLYGNKAFAASGMYGTNVVNKLAFTSSTQVRFVYGTGSTAVVAIDTISDTIIEVI